MVRFPSAIPDKLTHRHKNLRELTIVGDDFNTVVLPDTHAAARREKKCSEHPGGSRGGLKNVRVGGSEIDTDSTVKQFVGHFLV